MTPLGLFLYGLALAGGVVAVGVAGLVVVALFGWMMAPRER